MAKRDLNLYFYQIQSQYFEMLDNLKDMDEALKKGLIEEEQVTNIKVFVNKLKDNYQRLSYIMLLLNKPKNKKRVGNYEKQNEEIYKYLDKDSQEHVVTEDEDILKELKIFISDIKEKEVK